MIISIFLQFCTTRTTHYFYRFGNQVDSSSFCETNYSINAIPKLPPNFAAHFSKNLLKHPGILWQYSGDVRGMYYQYPTGKKHCNTNSSVSQDYRYTYVVTPLIRHIHTDAKPNKKLGRVLIHQWFYSGPTKRSTTYLWRSYQLDMFSFENSALTYPRPWECNQGR